MRPASPYSEPEASEVVAEASSKSTSWLWRDPSRGRRAKSLSAQRGCPSTSLTNHKRTWLASFASRGLSRRMDLVDKLRKVRRCTVPQPCPSDLETSGGLPSRLRPTGCIEDEAARRGTARLRPRERSRHCGRVVSRRTCPCDCDLREAVRRPRNSLRSEHRTKEEDRQGPMGVRKGATSLSLKDCEQQATAVQSGAN